MEFFKKLFFKKTKLQSEKIEKILNSQKNILIVTDGKQLITANKAFLDFFSYNKLEDFKKDYNCICDHFIKEDGFLQTKMGEITWVEYILKNPNLNHLAKIDNFKETHIFKVFAKKIDGEENLKNIEVVVTFEDITQELRVNEKLKHQKEKLENINRLKLQFLANISHELRTPLNAIIGFTELLFDTDLDENQYKLLKKIDNSSNILVNTIQSVLTLANIEDKSIQIEKSRFTFLELEKDIEDIYIKLAINSDNKFEINIDDKLPSSVVSDKALILQVISNLLSNAFKFTKNGSIKLDISLVELSKNIAKIRFSICDTGIGISKEFQNRIFEEFFQTDISNTRDYSGAGLGLSICQNIAKILNTKIELKSKLGEGSEFYFIVDIETNEEDNQKISEYPIFEDIAILVAEDNITNQELIKIILEKSNIKVTMAKNGKEAVELFSKNRFDLILMDLQMPVLSGFDATKKIREIDKQIPIVALTASNLIEDREKANEVLMDDFLLKPIDTEILYNVLIKYIKKLKGVKIAYKTIKNEPLNNILDLNVLKNKISDNKQIEMILRKFLEELEDDFKDIIEYLLNSNEKAKTLVHSLKGLSGNIGANRLFDICVKIDNKFKKAVSIDSSDIKILKDEIENIKNELNFLGSIFKDESNKVLNNDKFDENKAVLIIKSYIKKLNDSDMLSKDDLEILYENLFRLTNDSSILISLEKEIDDFEYEKAIEILKNVIGSGNFN
ncbi:MAG: response regulator [Aliarcobacter skirrowii]|uniref:response regulator n=1 Tax=Aliarcobacter skirrowii TaxID=28200 RepID=UPI00242BBDB2|nr:response regulator [Aliarcobacter skirrowii]MDD2508566.1 response regulator [Aliarcobacter skirrowii]MDD3497229.1 response regulator [Aliarcobacter skirrowii]